MVMDELMGGYLYLTVDAVEFDKECRRLLKDIHQFDVLVVIVLYHLMD